MIIMRAQHLQTFTTPNATVFPLATPRLGSRDLSVIRQHMSAGHSNPTHTQTHEEVMVMLGGQLHVTAGSDHTTLHAGDTLILPAHLPHQLHNPGPDEAQWLIISPAGMQFMGPDQQPMTPDWAR